MCTGALPIRWEWNAISRCRCIFPSDTLVPERYGRDGALVSFLGETGSFYRVSPVSIEGEWWVPRRYVRLLSDSTQFNHVVVVDRGRPEHCHPGTSGRRYLGHPQHESGHYGHAPSAVRAGNPAGMFVVQQKKSRMVFLKDGSAATGGYAPYASRFTNGAYIHGVPVNVPRTAMIEYSWSLGTTPRSHMCVRNATSHAKFVYDWAPTERSLVIVIE